MSKAAMDAEKKETKKRQRMAASVERKSEMKHLEAVVFGGGFDLGNSDVEEEEQEREEEKQAPQDDCGFEKLETEAEPPGVLSRRRKKSRAGDAAVDAKESAETRKPAWVDPDDASLQVSLVARNRTKKLMQTGDGTTQVAGDEYERRLRDQFRKLHGSATWADTSKAETSALSSDDDAEIEKVIPTSANAVLDKPTGGRLRPNELEVQRLKEAPIGAPGEKGPAAIQALHFHPTSEVLLAAGMDKTLRLFAVDGEDNPKISSHFIQNFPIMGAKFTTSGDQVVMTSTDNKLMGMDVKAGKAFSIKLFDAQAYRRLHGPFMGPSLAESGSRAAGMYAVLGDDGAVLLCDLRTHMPARTLRMSTFGASAAFSFERDVLWTADQETHLYEWDLGTGRCAQKTMDSYATRICSLAVSRVTPQAPKPILAVGTDTGNIDLFDAGAGRLSKIPFKSIGNLTTRIAGVQFHSQGELMVGFSAHKPEQVRFMHTQTTTVYQNWPPNKSPLGRVSAFDFATRDGLMAQGNERGRVFLYRLSHYAGSKR
eukprot:TRINITY_DN60743_c0_g1_i1.p1 TRINITY_DN60743_c0_g1~~TRINITY_DN60743_c0_g1_i1.p1  ORF type:complete len:540 (+),score=107.57 TRINITY_DN60743_c0_g1_i1:64-1683(+)